MIQARQQGEGKKMTLWSSKQPASGSLFSPLTPPCWEAERNFIEVRVNGKNGFTERTTFLLHQFYPGQAGWPLTRVLLPTCTFCVSLHRFRGTTTVEGLCRFSYRERWGTFNACSRIVLSSQEKREAGWSRGQTSLLLSRLPKHYFPPGCPTTRSKCPPLPPCSLNKKKK